MSDPPGFEHCKRLSRFSRRKRSKTALGHESGPWGGLFDEKTEGRKSHDTVPLTTEPFLMCCIMDTFR
jgi:hypothetical protein